MMNTSQYSSSTRTLIQRGFNPKRSGDVIIVLQTGWISNSWKMVAQHTDLHIATTHMFH